MNLSDIKDLSISNTLSKIKRRTLKNDTVYNYFEDLYDETGYERYNDIAYRVRECCKYWDVDYYRFQGVKDLVRTNTCKNLFCDNCQNAIAQRRQSKYSPLLDKLSKDYDLFHIVFTVPNVVGDLLSDTVSKMFSKFGYLIRYFNGSKKIKGIDFIGYDFQGCIRALEVTRNSSTREFHPHFHCIFVLRKDSHLVEEKTIINPYSYSNGILIRKFSYFEILLQKIWFLLFNDIKVTRESISSLEIGYSVIADSVSDGNYHEIFKYALKGLTKEDSPFGGFYDFKHLYFALFRRKIIQGYGIFLSYDFEELEFDVDSLYFEIVKYLHELENPERVYEYLDEVSSKINSQNIRYISRNSINTYFNEYDSSFLWDSIINKR